MESFEVNGSEVLLVSPLDGDVRAFQGICPHQDIPLIEGKFDGKVVICRAHQWVFDASSGEGVNPAGCRLAEYPLKIENGDILIDTDGVVPLFAQT